MATYAIGDIQGCLGELKRLLIKIDFKPDCDMLWFVGDLVNRGPESLQTLEYIYALNDNAVVVLGNHDLHLLATAYDHKKPGRKDTFHSLLASPRRKTLLRWLRQQKLIHHDKQLDVTMVHAGLHPQWSIKQAKKLAAEVESVLRSENHIEFYKHMYGDKPAYWSDELTGWHRLRYITNILTRLRYMELKDKGEKAVLQAKGSPDKANPALTPWFDIEYRASRKQRIIFGHWSTLMLVDRQYHNVFPIDTGCLWGGTLTALRIDQEAFISTAIGCTAVQTPGKFS